MTRLSAVSIMMSGAALSVLLGSAAHAAPGDAPESGPASVAPETGGGDIVVTARRENENLRDVPASITVLTAATLKQAGVVTTEQIVGLTPGVTIVSGAAQVGDAQINIRGVNGTRDAENSVALVVDGILKTNTAALNSYQGELQQVEVLKGPQGAYYGRNAAAGAIVMTTKKPGDRFEAEGRGSIANHSSQNVEGSLSGPLTDTLGGVLYGNFRHTDGFYKNTGPDKDAQGHTVDNYRGWNIGGRLLFTPTDKLQIDAKARYGKVKAAALDYDVDFELPSFASALGNPDFNQDVNDHKFQWNRNVVGKNWQETKEASIKATYDLSGATLSAWTSYSDIKEDFVSDAAVASLGRFNSTASCQASTAALFAAGVTLPSPQFLGPTPGSSLFGPYGPTTCDGYQYTLRNQKDISAEIRLASNGTGPFKWSAGGYYLNINRHFGTAINQDDGTGTVTRSLYNAPGTPNQTSQDLDDRFRTNVYAGFGSADYKPIEPVTLSAALRYDREVRHVQPLSPDAIDPVTGEAINPGYSVGAITPKSRTYSQWEPKVSAAWTVSPELNLYADWGIGFKAGGFNSQGSAAIINEFINAPLNASVLIYDDYKKERSDAFEIGFKSRLMGGKLLIDGAAYSTTVHNMQYFEFFVGSFGVLRVVSNIDKVQLNGVEGDITYKLTPSWSVFAAGNFVDSSIKKNSSRPSTVGNESPYTAKYTLNFGTQLVQPITETYSATFRADYRVTGPTWFSTVQNQSVRGIFDLSFPGLGTANYSTARRDTYGLLDLRAGIQTKRWSLTAFSTNVTNKKYLGEVIPAPEFGGAFISPGDGRIIGAELGLTF